ncbi:uncharacterized protein [Venturia canescens]|nr:uncharacterized protein LOC122408701 isoform X2 [Venturia canescens]XP_043271600.1 uncharacterized protein LOC122408701 isoform X2 [Venturia canescens]
MHQKIANKTESELRQKEKEEINEMRKLEEMEYKKLERMESFCDKTWRFSTSNNLLTLFNKYLKIPRYAYRKELAFDIDPNMLKLKSERDQLRTELAEKSSRAQDLEGNLSDLKIQLQNLESYRYDNPEIIRLKKNIEDYQQKIECLNSKISKLEMGAPVKEENGELVVDEFENKKFEFIRASELIEKSETIQSPKKCKFKVKKESGVSRKLSSLRGTNRGQ